MTILAMASSRSAEVSTRTGTLPGVGPGNVPVLVDTSADLEDAIAKIVIGKSFDYGTVCSSEQALVAEYSLRDRILALLKQLSLIHISEPTRLGMISYAVF